MSSSLYPHPEPVWRWGSRSRTSTGAGALPLCPLVCTGCRGLRQRFKEASLSPLGRSPCPLPSCTTVSVYDSVVTAPPAFSWRSLRPWVVCPRAWGGATRARSPSPSSSVELRGLLGRRSRGVRGELQGEASPGPSRGASSPVGLARAPACSIDVLHQGSWPVTRPGARTGASGASEGPGALAPRFLSRSVCGRGCRTCPAKGQTGPRRPHRRDHGPRAHARLLQKRALLGPGPWRPALHCPASATPCVGRSGGDSGAPRAGGHLACSAHC